jgi:hypothetical protein
LNLNFNKHIEPNFERVRYKIFSESATKWADPPYPFNPQLACELKTILGDGYHTIKPELWEGNISPTAFHLLPELEKFRATVNYWSKLYKIDMPEYLEILGSILDPNFPKKYDDKFEFYLQTVSDKTSEGWKGIRPPIPLRMLKGVVGIERPFPVHAFFPWEEVAESKLKEMMYIPLITYEDPFDWDLYERVAVEMMEGGYKPHFHPAIIWNKMGDQKLWDPLKKKKVRKMDFLHGVTSKNPLDWLNKYPHGAVESMVWKHPGEVRDSIITSPRTLTAITWLNTVIESLCSHNPEWGNGFDTGAMGRFCPEDQYLFYSCCDIKKSGMTMPHECIKRQIAAINSLHGLDPILEDFPVNGFPILLLSGESISPKRGYGLGMVNASYTLHLSILYRMFCLKYPEKYVENDLKFVAFNDDSVLRIKADLLSQAQDIHREWEIFLVSSDTVIHAEKNFLSQGGCVFCEIHWFHSDFTINYKAVQEFNTLLNCLKYKDSDGMRAYIQDVVRAQGDPNYPYKMTFLDIKEKKSHIYNGHSGCEFETHTVQDKLFSLIKDVVSVFREYQIHFLPNCPAEIGGIDWDPKSASRSQILTFLIDSKESTDMQRALYLAYCYSSHELAYVQRPWRIAKKGYCQILDPFPDDVCLWNINDLNDRMNGISKNNSERLTSIDASSKFWKNVRFIYDSYDGAVNRDLFQIEVIYLNVGLKGQVIPANWVVKWGGDNEELMWTNVPPKFKEDAQSTYLEIGADYFGQGGTHFWSNKFCDWRNCFRESLQLPIFEDGRPAIPPIEVSSFLKFGNLRDTMALAFEYHKKVPIACNMPVLEKLIGDLSAWENQYPGKGKITTWTQFPFLIDKKMSDRLSEFPWEFHTGMLLGHEFGYDIDDPQILEIAFDLAQATTKVPRVVRQTCYYKQKNSLTKVVEEDIYDEAIDLFDDTIFESIRDRANNLLANYKSEIGGTLLTEPEEEEEIIFSTPDYWDALINVPQFVNDPDKESDSESGHNSIYNGVPHAIENDPDRDNLYGYLPQLHSNETGGHIIYDIEHGCLIEEEGYESEEEFKLPSIDSETETESLCSTESAAARESMLMELFDCGEDTPLFLAR